MRVTVYELAQVPGVVTSVYASDGLVSQPSVAVGIINTGAVGQAIVEGAGSTEITGAVLSLIVIIWVNTVLIFPQLSLAVQVFV